MPIDCKNNFVVSQWYEILRVKTVHLYSNLILNFPYFHCKIVTFMSKYGKKKNWIKDYALQCIPVIIGQVARLKGEPIITKFTFIFITYHKVSLL